VMPLTRDTAERIRAGYDDAGYKSTFTLLTYSINCKQSVI